MKSPGFLTRTISKLLLSAALLSSALLSPVTMANPPALAYSFMLVDEPLEICTHMADSAIRSSIIGSLDRQQQSISLKNDEYHVAVHCKPTGNNANYVTILVAHEDDQQAARKLLRKIEKAMHNGNLE